MLTFPKQSCGRAGAESRWEQPLAPNQLFPWPRAVSMVLGNGFSKVCGCSEPRTWPLHSVQVCDCTQTASSLCFLSRLALPLHLSPTFSQNPLLLLFPSSERNIRSYFPVNIPEAVSERMAVRHDRITAESKTRSQDACLTGCTLSTCRGGPGLCGGRGQGTGALSWLPRGTGVRWLQVSPPAHTVSYPPGQVPSYEERTCSVESDVWSAP